MLYLLIKEIKEIIANKKIWLGMIVVLIIIIIGTSYNRKNSQQETSDLLKLGVINQDNSTYSGLLLEYFNSSETFSSLITVNIGESQEIRSKFQKGDLDIYLEIPEDFAQNMIHMNHSPVKVVINIEDTTKAILFQNILKSYEKYIAAVEANAVGLYEIMEQDGMDQKLIDDTNRTVSLDMILTALGKEAFFSFHPIDKFPATMVSEYYMISILIMALLYMGLFSGFQLLKEVKYGTLFRLKTTRTSMFQLISVKILGMSLLLSILSSCGLLIVRNGKLTLGGVILGVTISVFCVTFSVFFSTLFTTIQRYILAGNLLYFYFIIIGGGIIPIQFLPQDILRVSRITPNYYMMEGMIRYLHGQGEAVNGISTGFFLISLIFYITAAVLAGRRRGAYEDV